jgi:hypothetical protein
MAPSMKRFLLLLTIFPFTAGAWTRNSDHQIAQKGAQLAPRDLRLVIHRLEKSYASGVDRAIAEEGVDIHRARLRERIESETTDVIRMIRTNQPMTRVVVRLGMLSHLVGDANNPFHVHTEEALEPSHGDFERYFERRMQKFPTVFYGLDARFRLDTYLDRTFQRTSNLAPLVSEEYFRDGERRTSDEFDDRSTAFGVASLCYSHAVTDLVNLYYYIWKEAGGDVRSAASMRGSRIIPNAN